MLRIGNAHRSAARRQPADARGVRQGAGEPARAPTLSVLVNAAKPVNQRLRDSPICRADWAGTRITSRYSTKRRAKPRCRAGSRCTTIPAPAFTNANAQLVAGKLNLDESGEERIRPRQQRRNANQRSAGTESTGQAAARRLLPLPDCKRAQRRMANKQTKQVSFLEADRVARPARATRPRSTDSAPATSPPPREVRMRFSNSKADRPGRTAAELAWCACTCAMRRGQPQFIGEDHIGHTSSRVRAWRIKIGDAFDVTVTAHAGSRPGGSTSERTDYQMSYLVRNGRAPTRSP